MKTGKTPARIYMGKGRTRGRDRQMECLSQGRYLAANSRSRCGALFDQPPNDLIASYFQSCGTPADGESTTRHMFFSLIHDLVRCLLVGLFISFPSLNSSLPRKFPTVSGFATRRFQEDLHLRRLRWEQVVERSACPGRRPPGGALFRGADQEVDEKRMLNTLQQVLSAHTLPHTTKHSCGDWGHHLQEKRRLKMQASLSKWSCSFPLNTPHGFYLCIAMLT